MASIPDPPPGFDDLSIDEQIEYVRQLWDRVEANRARGPLPDWQRLELERRLAELERNPEQGRTWDEVRSGLLHDLDSISPE